MFRNKLSRLCLGLLIVSSLVFNQSAHATWSIIVVNPLTKEIGIGGASCTMSVYGIGAIVPGKGAIVVQAMSNGLARMEGFRRLMNDEAPSTIMEKIRQPDFDPENQQYAILSLADYLHPLTYTGTKTNEHGGSITGNGISVQGNTLSNPEVIQAVYDAAVKAQMDSLPVQEILMLAMEAGAKAGGDKRCGERRASSAFIIVAKPADAEKYWLSLIVYGNDDHTPAVEELRKKFNQWKLRQEELSENH